MALDGSTVKVVKGAELIVGIPVAGVDWKGKELSSTGELNVGSAVAVVGWTGEELSIGCPGELNVDIAVACVVKGITGPELRTDELGGTAKYALTFLIIMKIVQSTSHLS